jgi:hypothetical protein
MAVLALGLGACSQEDPTPMGDLLIYVERSVRIDQFIDVEVNGQPLGRLTSTVSRTPDCNDPASGSLLKTRQELDKELSVKFTFSDRSTRTFTTKIPSTLDSDECWQLRLF